MSKAIAEAAQAATRNGAKKQQVSVYKQRTQRLGEYRTELSQMIPKRSGLDPDRLINIASSVITQDSKLSNCNERSIMAAVMNVAIMGLNPLPQMAQAYFVPYKNQCTFQLGYRGYLELFWRTGLVKRVEVFIVREGDHYRRGRGTHSFVEYEPADDHDDAPMKYAVCVIEFENGGLVWNELTVKQVESLRKRSPGQKGAPSGAWATDYEAMAMAKVMKTMKRFMPTTGQPQHVEESLAMEDRAVSLDNFANDGTGLQDDAEYIATLPESGDEPPSEASQVVADEQAIAFIKAAKDLDWSKDDYTALLAEYGYETPHQIEVMLYDEIMEALEDESRRDAIKSGTLNMEEQPNA